MSTIESAEAGSLTRPASAVADLPPGSELWLIRHGETAWSLSGQHTGTTDLDLTEFGVRQAEALRPLLAKIKPALALASPRSRAQRTAELCGVRVNGIDEDLAEWDYGDFEGLTSAQIAGIDPSWTIWRGYTPNGETPEQITVRVDRVVARAIAALGEGPVVLFGHGHINRAIAARWLELHVSAGSLFALGTAAPCVLGIDHERPVVVRWNMTNPATA